MEYPKEGSKIWCEIANEIDQEKSKKREEKFNRIQQMRYDYEAWCAKTGPEAHKIQRELIDAKVELSWFLDAKKLGSLTELKRTQRYLENSIRTLSGFNSAISSLKNRARNHRIKNEHLYYRMDVKISECIDTLNEELNENKKRIATVRKYLNHTEEEYRNQIALVEKKQQNLYATRPPEPSRPKQAPTYYSCSCIYECECSANRNQRNFEKEWEKEKEKQRERRRIMKRSDRIHRRIFERFASNHAQISL